MRSYLLTCLTALLAGPAPLLAQISVVGEMIHEREALPGTTYDGMLVVRNTTSEPQQARIHQTDYRFYADGRSFYGEPGSTPRSNAAWLTISPALVTIPAGEVVRIHYRVQLPDAPSDSLHGTYWSMLIVEGVKAPRTTPTRPGHLTLRPTIRHGVQVVTHVGSTGAPSIAFAQPVLGGTSQDGFSLEVDLSNEGDRASRIDATLELFTQEGRSVASLRSARGLVYPGSSIRQRFDLGTLSPGRYTALVMADAGADAVAGAQFTLSF